MATTIYTVAEPLSRPDPGLGKQKDMRPRTDQIAFALRQNGRHENLSHLRPSTESRRIGYATNFRTGRHQAERETTNPTETLRIRDARRDLIQALAEIAIRHKAENNLRDAARVNNEALELAIRNMDLEGNSRVGDDALLVLDLCVELLQLKSNSPDERARLLEIKVRALQKADRSQGFGALTELVSERLRLSKVYVLELNNRKRADQVYSDIQSDIKTFRATRPCEREAIWALSDEAERVWQSFLRHMAQTRWRKCLGEVLSRVRRDMPRTREMRQKADLLSRRLLARKRWTTVLRRVKRRARRIITERRSNVIIKWCDLTQQLLEKQKMETRLLEEQKEKETAEYFKRTKLEMRKVGEEERRKKLGENRGVQRQKHEENDKRRQATRMQNMNQVSTGVRQGGFHTGNGLPEMSETDYMELGPVLFDARPTAESRENVLSERWMKDFIKFRKSILAGKFDEHSMERVRVTIIDTGIDGTHPYINKRWRRYREGTNIPLFKDFDNAVDYPVDEDGHGTFIAGLVLRLAPDVEVSVARVCRDQSSMSKDRSRESKVAEAISYAINTWETDIISISIGYETDMTGEIRAAISKVQQTNRVVMLCSAGNFGNTKANISFPARADGVFKIFACDHNGYSPTMNPQAPSDSDYCFSILGCNVQSTWPMALKEMGEATGLNMVEKPQNAGLWTTMSGTSFATPIAAALVAIIYQFHDEYSLLMNLPPGIKMKTPETVKTILLRMSLPPGINGYNTLAPTVGRRNHFKFHPGREKHVPSFFAIKLNDVVWEDMYL